MFFILCIDYGVYVSSDFKSVESAKEFCTEASLLAFIMCIVLHIIRQLDVSETRDCKWIDSTFKRLHKRQFYDLGLMSLWVVY